MGQELVVTIESISKKSYNTDVAEIKGFVMFMPDAKTGDIVSMRITEVGGGYAEPYC